MVQREAGRRDATPCHHLQPCTQAKRACISHIAALLTPSGGAASSPWPPESIASPDEALKMASTVYGLLSWTLISPRFLDDSWKFLSVRHVNNIPRHHRDNTLKFSCIFVMDTKGFHLWHDQQQQPSVSEYTLLK